MILTEIVPTISECQSVIRALQKTKYILKDFIYNVNMTKKTNRPKYKIVIIKL